MRAKRAFSGDVKAVLTGIALRLAAETVHHVAELTVVHVDAAAPHDAAGVDVQLVALIDVVVQHGGQQVVGSADGVEVAGEVEVDVLHGDYLSVAAAGSAALDAEHGAEGGLTQGDDGLLAQLAQRVADADGGGGLALAGGGRVDGGDQDQLGLVVGVALVQQVVVDLRLVLAVVVEILLGQTELGCDLTDVARSCFLCNFDVALESHCNHDLSYKFFVCFLYFLPDFGAFSPCSA